MCVTILFIIDAMKFTEHFVYFSERKTNYLIFRFAHGGRELIIVWAKVELE